MSAIYPETEYNFVIGKSPQMREVYRQMQTAAKGAGSVLIAGESGTGKDLVAQYIHHKSGRAPNPFVPVNCGAIPKELFESELFGHKKGSFTGAVNETAGLFRSADTGTIFLDEITEIPLETQVKLLRVLQEKRIRPLGSTEEIPLDVQVIAATNRDLEQVLWNRSFREDLYYRLGAVTIYIPPLREHLEDIPELVAAFIQRLNQRLKRNILGVHPDIIQHLTKYSWPGNVRQLENVIENAYLFTKGKWITRLGLKLEEDPQSLVRSTGEISTSLDPSEFYLPSNAMSTSLRRKIQSAAKSSAGVLILGEEGTGSHMVGREIHRQSTYAKGPFVIVYCDTIPPECFEKELFGSSIFEDMQEPFKGYVHQAEKGTLFLHEVTAMPYRIQMLLFHLFNESRLRPTGFSRDLPKKSPHHCLYVARPASVSKREKPIRWVLYPIERACHSHSAFARAKRENSRIRRLFCQILRHSSTTSGSPNSRPSTGISDGLFLAGQSTGTALCYPGCPYCGELRHNSKTPPARPAGHTLADGWTHRHTGQTLRCRAGFTSRSTPKNRWKQNPGCSTSRYLSEKGLQNVGKLTPSS